MKSAPRVSLADELAELADALEAAQLIAELLVTGSLPDDDSAARAPKMLEATLALAIGRVRLLRKTIVGAADVRLVVGRHNIAHARRAGDDPDTYLSSSPRPRGR